MARRFQFSVRLLLLLTALIATIFGGMVATPSWQAGACLLLLAEMLPACFVVGAMCGHGWLRVFCAGAVIPASLAPFIFALFGLMGVSMNSKDPFREFTGNLCDHELKLVLVLFWIAVPIVGVTAVLFYWALGDDRDAEPKPPGARP